MVQRAATEDEPLVLQMRLSVLSDVSAWVGFTLFKIEAHTRILSEFSCRKAAAFAVCQQYFCENVYVYPSIQLTKASKWKAVMKWI